MQDPDAQLERWSEALWQFIAETDEATKHVASAVVSSASTALTRQRLTAVAESLPRHRDAISELFREVGIEPRRARTTSDPGASLLSYYTLVHRDWGWPPEVDEVTPSLEAIISSLPEGFSLGQTLVLGAGTARLAWELSQRLPNPGVTLALDVNPLPFLVTARLMRGQRVEVYELPGHPKRASFAAVRRVLEAPNPPPPGLRLMLADGLDPPLARGSFDTVITPWFVDQVPEDAQSVVSLVHDLLTEGGSWINHGPLVYDPTHTAPAHRYCADEFLQLAARGGFRVTSAKYESAPYFASPISSQGRTETVLTLHAHKTPAIDGPTVEPDWLRPETRDRTPVPKLAGLGGYEAPHPVVSSVAALIDGTRSARDICRILVDAGTIAADGNEQTVVYGCLKVIYQALGAGGRPAAGR